MVRQRRKWQPVSWVIFPFACPPKHRIAIPVGLWFPRVFVVVPFPYLHARRGKQNHGSVFRCSINRQPCRTRRWSATATSFLIFDSFTHYLSLSGCSGGRGSPQRWTRQAFRSRMVRLGPYFAQTLRRARGGPTHARAGLRRPVAPGGVELSGPPQRELFADQDAGRRHPPQLLVGGVAG